MTTQAQAPSVAVEAVAGSAQDTTQTIQDQVNVEQTQSTVEAPQTPAVAAHKESQIAAISKQRKQMLAMKRELDQMKAEKASMSAKLGELEPKFQKAKSNPIEALMAAGWTYKDATDFVLNNSQTTPEQKFKSVEERVAEVERRYEEAQRKSAEEQKNQAESAAKQAEESFRSDIEEFGSQNAETYELTHFYGGHDLVFETIKTHWEQSNLAHQEDPENNPRPKILSIQQGYELVEKHYEELEERKLKLKKIQARLGQKSKEAEQKTASKTESVTLSNAIPSSSAPSMIPAKTEHDRIKRALAAMDSA